MMKIAVVLLLILNVACGFVLTSYGSGGEALDESSWDDTLYRMTRLPREIPATTVLDPLVKGELLAPEGEKREASAFELHDAEKGVAAGKLNINTATIKELMNLPRIGKGSAEKIIKFREEHGGFKTIVEITQVSRIGKSAFEGFRDMITVSGASTVGAVVADDPGPGGGTSSASPSDATAVVAAAPTAGEESSSGKINLNTASVKQLMTLPRIGKGTAAKIIKYRDEHGGFKTVDELSNVPRIGTKMVDKLRPLVTVGGIAATPAVDAPAVDAPAVDAPAVAEPDAGEPAKTSLTPAVPAATGEEPSSVKVDLNTATVEQLMTIPKVGPGTAEKIVKYREEHGGFKTVDDLVNVPRMGQKTVDNLRAFITVSGGAVGEISSPAPATDKPPSAPAPAAPATTGEGPSSGRVDLNTATVEQLMTLPRVGQGTAEKIVKYREEHGGFKTVDDLANVPRMGQKTVDNLRAFIRVSGGTVGIPADSVLAPTGTAADTPIVPKPEKTPPAPAAGKINLNTATVEQLMTLPRVGQGTAEKIVKYREEQGGFKTVDDLANVPRMGQKTVDNLRAFITVGGSSSSSPAVKQTPAGAPVKKKKTAGASGKINLNTATAEELQQLPWVGPGAAAKIIEYRTLHGKYTSVQDLLNIKGFSQTALDAIKNLVVTE